MIFFENIKKIKHTNNKMRRCRGQKCDGTQCSNKVDHKEWKLCLAHKLKKLPRELLEQIFFEFVPSSDSPKESDLLLLKTYSTIYSEALPAYFRLKFKMGSWIVRELVAVPVVFPCRQEVDKAILRMLFLTPWQRSHREIFRTMINYCLNYVFTKCNENEKNVVLNMKFSYYGTLNDETKTQIESLLIGWTGYRHCHQMTNLVFFLERVYRVYYKSNVVGNFWPTKTWFDNIVHEVCSIKPNGVSMFSEYGYNAIFS